MHSFIHLFTLSFIRLFVHSFIHSFDACIHAVVLRELRAGAKPQQSQGHPGAAGRPLREGGGRDIVQPLGDGGHR